MGTRYSVPLLKGGYATQQWDSSPTSWSMASTFPCPMTVITRPLCVAYTNWSGMKLDMLSIARSATPCCPLMNSSVAQTTSTSAACDAMVLRHRPGARWWKTIDASEIRSRFLSVTRSLVSSLIHFSANAQPVFHRTEVLSQIEKRLGSCWDQYLHAVRSRLELFSC